MWIVDAYQKCIFFFVKMKVSNEIPKAEMNHYSVFHSILSIT